LILQKEIMKSEKNTIQTENAEYTLMPVGESAFLLRISGCMDHRCAGSMFKRLLADVERLRPSLLSIDLSQVTSMEDFGIAVIFELKRVTKTWGGIVEIPGTDNRTEELLKMLPPEHFEKAASFFKQESPGLLVRLGGASLQTATDLRFMISFVGSLFLACMHVLRHPGRLRWGNMILSMEKVGVDAVPIIALISFLMGFIMAFMSSVQLRQFGANIYVASLVALAMVRELGPIITGIIVAGRSGSAFAAEISTMKISEEVDALHVMGIDPTLFLAVPKLIASVIVVPILTLLSDLFAIMGGLLVGVSMLNLSLRGYLDETLRAVTPFDVGWGFVKGAAFAALIAWIGCLRGFQAHGGAEAVGTATTSSVVTSIFLIILADSIFAIIRTYWG
jgi:phospholipid/cholesterol/gamma-HCH transport system permease protein